MILVEKFNLFHSAQFPRDTKIPQAQFLLELFVELYPERAQSEVTSLTVHHSCLHFYNHLYPVPSITYFFI